MVNDMKFKYECYYKFKDKLGYSILIDENDTVEILKLDNNGKIMTNQYIPIPLVIKNNIFNLIKENIEVFNLNSCIFSSLYKEDIEQIFYFELDNLNRKIESNCINEYNKNKEVLIIMDLFKKIKFELNKIDIDINIDEINCCGIKK